MGLVETWSDFKDEFSNFLDQFTYFDCIREKPRKALRNSGGVGVYIRNSLLKESFTY